MKVVLDTNVLIAAALKGDFAESIISLAAEHVLTLLTSEEILAELAQKLRLKFHWIQKDVTLYTTRVIKISQLVSVTEKLSVVARDPKDNKILECAVCGNADLIVSADQDLIALKTFRGIAIVHPKTLSWTFPEYFKKKN